MLIIRNLDKVKWGEYSLVALYISILSGIVVALKYDPAHPFYSSVAIDSLIPFGRFLRSLHFYSSQIFFVFSGFHLWAVIKNRTVFRLSLPRYVMLVASIPVTILLLFTGYILRGDSTGESAGVIAENIVLSIPLLGGLLNELLFNITKEGIQNVYVNHLIGLVVLWVVLVWDHIRRYPTGFLKHGLLIFLVMGLSLVLKAPMDIDKPGELMISGPWFFLGIQELLRFIHPFWSGVVIPLMLVAALAMIRLEDIWGKRAVYFVCSWLVLYGGITVYLLV
ncbi:MAG: cytochrome b N-terminal domain-containing protein [Desulfurivibrionaceae bacterium]